MLWQKNHQGLRENEVRFPYFYSQSNTKEALAFQHVDIFVLRIKVAVDA